MRAYHYPYPVKLQPEQHRLLETMGAHEQDPNQALSRGPRAADE